MAALYPDARLHCKRALVRFRTWHHKCRQSPTGRFRSFRLYRRRTAEIEVDFSLSILVMLNLFQHPWTELSSGAARKKWRAMDPETSSG